MTMQFTVVSILPDDIDKDVFFTILHPREEGTYQIRRHIDWANETPMHVVKKYVQSAWNVGGYHGDASLYETEFLSGPNVVVFRLDFDDPQPVVLEKPTTRTYAVPADAANMALAMTTVDLHGVLDMIEEKFDSNDEFHVTCTGLPKLHSDMLGHFEWTGV